MKFIVTYLSKKMVFSQPVEAREIVGNDKNIVCVTVNNRVRELTYEVYYDAKIDFLTVLKSLKELDMTLLSYSSQYLDRY